MTKKTFYLLFFFFLSTSIAYFDSGSIVKASPLSELIEKNLDFNNLDDCEPTYEPTTLYGVNFSMDKKTIHNTLSKRFDCEMKYIEYKNLSSNNNSTYACVNDDFDDSECKQEGEIDNLCLLFLTFDKVTTGYSAVSKQSGYELERIKFPCKAWNGCRINPATIFRKIVEEKYKKFSCGYSPKFIDKKTKESESCMIGIMGEKICVYTSADITMERFEFNDQVILD